ncbi:MAG TPA: hypothetical protein PKE51_10465, partial [Gemmatimonadaceae bacterium]|nr:hypothetical protein [Gemmatimonadaceae bacterium]
MSDPTLSVLAPFTSRLVMSSAGARGRLRRVLVGTYATALAAAVLLCPTPSRAQAPEFLRARVDEARNKLLLEIPVARLGQSFLYQNTLATGLGTGSLDRG